MKTFLVILALIAVSSAVHNKHINMIQKHLYNLAQTGYAVDTVLELLHGLKNVQIASLNDATANWDTASSNWEAQIAFDNQQITDQDFVCQDIDSTIAGLKDERRKYGRYIKDAQNTIETNAETLAARLDARCTANLAYVNKLKANHDAAALLEFLRGQISNPGFRDYLAASQGALAELRQHITHKKHHALSAIAKHHMMALLQQNYQGEDDLHYDQRARTDEEIGTKHHDNDKSGLALDNFTIDARNLDDFLAELLGFIDALIDQIHQDNANLAASEFAAVEDLIAYQDQIEQEAIVLNLYISLWGAHIDELTATIDQNEAASAECHGRLDYLTESLHNDEAAYAAENEAFIARRDSLQHTIDALDEVIEVYASKVAGAAEQYKREYDEEIAAKENAGRNDNNGWDNSAEEAFFVQRRRHNHHKGGGV